MVPEVLSALVVSWMVQLSPPERAVERVTYPEAVETLEERTGRYMSIAEDVTRAVEWLPTSRQRGAAELLVAIAFHESGFAKDVDLGPCAPGRLKGGGCDHGRARGLWQVQAYDFSDREEAARLALKLAYRSMTACRDLPVEERLAVYASGNCKSEVGRRRSREIWSVLKKVRTMPAVALGGARSSGSEGT